jgi:two-component system nitrogen regulation sensor histidine kinase NtrY
MGSDLNREAGGLQAEARRAERLPGALASYHAFPSAYVVNRQGQVLARAEAEDAPPYMPPPASSFQVADQGRSRSRTTAAPR